VINSAISDGAKTVSTLFTAFRLPFWRHGPYWGYYAGAKLSFVFVIVLLCLLIESHPMAVDGSNPTPPQSQTYSVASTQGAQDVEAMWQGRMFPPIEQPDQK
jgi:uncharacterized protein DUF3309